MAAGTCAVASPAISTPQTSEVKAIGFRIFSMASPSSNINARPFSLAENGRAWAAGTLRRHSLFQVLVDLVEEPGRREPFLLRADQEREVLGHEAGFDRVDGNLLKRGGEFCELRILVEFRPVREP